MNIIKPTRLQCCVCDRTAGIWRQWWNRDTGHGICLRCATEQAQRETPERMQQLYGRAGINYPVTNAK